MFGGLFAKRNKPVSTGSDAPTGLPEPPPLPPPPPCYSGIPICARCLAVDPIQGTIAVGDEAGAVHLFGEHGAEQRLPPPSMDAPHPVLQMCFVANDGRLLVLHAPALACAWSLRGASAHLMATTTLSRISAISTCHVVCRSSTALFGTEHASVLACRLPTVDRERIELSNWCLSLPTFGMSGAVCALDGPRPSDASARLLVGLRGGALLVAQLVPPKGGVAPDTSPSKPVVLGAHSDSTGLCCACWLADGGVVAGYDNGELCVFSLRNPDRPSQVLQVASIGPPPSLAATSQHTAPPPALAATAAAAAAATAFPAASIKARA